MQIGPKIDDIGGCARIACISIYGFSRFLDAANASSMPHLLRNLILMILLFYRTILSCLESENVLNSILQCKSSKFDNQPKQQCHGILNLREPLVGSLSFFHFGPEQGRAS